MLAVTTVVAVVAAVAGFVLAWQAKRETDRMFREATSLRLAAEALSMLYGTRPEGDVRAFQQLVAARRLAQTPDDGPLREALMDRMNTLKIIGAPRSIDGVTFSPDGGRIVSGSRDTTVRLWDAATDRPIDQPLRAGSQVDSVAFSPDGDFLVSGSEDGTVRLWLTYPDFVAALCDKLATNMSEYDWEKWVSPDIAYIKACPGLPIPSLF